jgi:hypothetical protein
VAGPQSKRVQQSRVETERDGGLRHTPTLTSTEVKASAEEAGRSILYDITVRSMFSRQKLAESAHSSTTFYLLHSSTSLIWLMDFG